MRYDSTFAIRLTISGPVEGGREADFLDGETRIKCDDENLKIIKNLMKANKASNS